MDAAGVFERLVVTPEYIDKLIVACVELKILSSAANRAGIDEYGFRVSVSGAKDDQRKAARDLAKSEHKVSS